MSTRRSRDDILPQSERLQALSTEEDELLWGHPVLPGSDRALFLQLTSREQAYYSHLRKPKTRAHFILQLGQFRARQRFFTLEPSLLKDDLTYVYNRDLKNAGS
ncbi:MAG: DUF4158 domain-containing protein [Pseudomonadota bacterium]